MNSLYEKYRPRKFAEVVGQANAVKVLTGKLKTGDLPHAILFTGPSGTGKTTLAKILAARLGATDTDLMEINAASERGIDMVRQVQRAAYQEPCGKSRVFIIDEAHKMTGDAQTAFLKVLEPIPDTCYFMLPTTDPGKLLKAIHSRCTAIALKAVKFDDVMGVLIRIAEAEGFSASQEVLEKIVEAADGGVRKAIVLLEQVGGLADEADQLDAIATSSAEASGFAIAQALMAGKKWPTVRALVTACEDEPETVRRIILSYFTSVMLGNSGPKADRAKFVLDVFIPNWYDCGKAGLAASCYDVCKAAE